MADSRKVVDLLGSRREVLRLGGLGFLGASIDGVWPLKASSTGPSVTARNNARRVIFLEANGAISPIDCFDFKENVATPEDLDVREAYPGMYLSHRLFPALSRHMDKFAVLRSLRSHEEVHFRGQYYLQTGRQNNLAFAKEIPAVGSVVAAELEAQRRPSDTFPLYMSFNLAKGAVGALATGFLPPRFSVVDINTENALREDKLDHQASALLEQRWSLLRQLREVEGARPGYGREMAGYDDFYSAAHRLLSDSRWPRVFQASEDDKARYGKNGVGMACLLARNLVLQDGGTRYIHICHPGWDHHTHIWDRSKETNHYIQCAEYDRAFSSLLDDLSSLPSKDDEKKTLLDETLLVSMSEFGRTPGPLNYMQGRDHYNRCFPALFAGAGVAGRRILGATDKDGAACVDTGWEREVQPRIENVVSTMYSALGIDWTKKIKNLPSGRTYVYVDPLGANGFISTDEISTIYG